MLLWKPSCSASWPSGPVRLETNGSRVGLGKDMVPCHLHTPPTGPALARLFGSIMYAPQPGGRLHCTQLRSLRRWECLRGLDLLEISKLPAAHQVVRVVPGPLESLGKRLFRLC